MPNSATTAEWLDASEATIMACTRTAIMLLSAIVLLAIAVSIRTSPDFTQAAMQSPRVGVERTVPCDVIYKTVPQKWWQSLGCW